MLRRIHAALSQRPTAATALALLVLVLGGCGGAESRRQSHLVRGRAYLEQGDFTHASLEFRNAIQIDPRDPGARLLAGEAAEKLGRWREAAALYQSVVDMAPADVEARASLARLYDLGGAPEQALKLIQPVLAQHPDDPRLLVARGFARAKLNDADGALSDAQRAVQLAPADESAVGLLAGLYRERGESARAIELINASLPKVPGSTDLRELLVEVYVEGGETDQAVGELKKLVALKPNAVPYRGELARVYARSGRIDDAQRVLEDLVKAQPGSNDAKLALVDFLATQRTPAEAQRVLKGFITSDPDNTALRLGLGALLQRTGSTDEALTAYRELLRRGDVGPDALAARDRIAAILLNRGQTADATKMIGEVLSENPQDGDALRMRGGLELAHHDNAAAIVDFRAVLRDQPAEVAVRGSLASALLANQQPALAEDELRTALEIAPADAATREGLAQLYLGTHRAAQAITVLEEGVQRTPANIVEREALIKAYLAKGDPAAARTAAEALKTQQPKLSSAYYLSGQVALAQQHPDDAEREFERALELDPGAFEPLAAVSHLELSRGQSSRAITRLDQVVGRYPGNAEALEMLGEAYLVTGDFAHASDALTRAAHAAPNWWYPDYNLATARQGQHDDPGAIKALQAGIRLDPAEPQLALRLAVVYEEQGRVDDAIATCEALYEHNSTPKVAASLALLLATYRKDQASLDRARDLSAGFGSSTDPALLDTSGWVLFKRGDNQQALPMLERAVAREPGSKLIRYHLALAELRAGQRDRARADLESALAGRGNFPGSDQARSVLTGLKS